MITSWRYTKINNHDAILTALESRKAILGDQFTVLDIGASDNPWTAEVLGATFDLRKCNAPNVLNFTGNLNEYQDWTQLLDYVAVHGKFSYTVCSHTLEDLAYPKLTLDMLPRISQAGFISMPSHFQDLTRIEGDWPGYIHHRWLFVIENDKIVLVPKIPFVAKIEGVSNPPVDRTELQIFWDKTVPYEILNGDFLGPNVQYVKDMYAKVLGGRY
jgi:hypothetical protein